MTNTIDRLQVIRAQLAQNMAKTSQTPNSSRYYAFWNLDVNQQSVIRFLPDGNVNNTMFWRDVYEVKLPFPAEGGKTVYVNVPHLGTWGEKDPIDREISPLWKTDRETAKTYWRKATHLYTGLVVKSGFVEQRDEGAPQVRLFRLNSGIHKIVQDTLMDQEINDLICDYDTGRDFYIKVTKQGVYKNYDTSKISINTRSLDDVERATIKSEGLIDLSVHLPTKPNPEQQAEIARLFEASMAGEMWQEGKWGSTYKPKGQAVETPQAAAQQAPVAETKPVSTAAELIAKVRRRGA
jgi:hypothetical protein